jgi:hypothetical protein
MAYYVNTSGHQQSDLERPPDLAENHEPDRKEMVYSSAGQFGAHLNAVKVWARTYGGVFEPIAPGNGQPSGCIRS